MYICIFIYVYNVWVYGYMCIYIYICVYGNDWGWQTDIVFDLNNVGLIQV